MFFECYPTRSLMCARERSPSATSRTKTSKDTGLRKGNCVISDDDSLPRRVPPCPARPVVGSLLSSSPAGYSNREGVGSIIRHYDADVNSANSNHTRRFSQANRQNSPATSCRKPHHYAPYEAPPPPHPRPHAPLQFYDDEEPWAHLYAEAAVLSERRESMQTEGQRRREEVSEDEFRKITLDSVHKGRHALDATFDRLASTPLRANAASGSVDGKRKSPDNSCHRKGPNSPGRVDSACENKTGDRRRSSPKIGKSPKSAVRQSPRRYKSPLLDLPEEASPFEAEGFASPIETAVNVDVPQEARDEVNVARTTHDPLHFGEVREMGAVPCIEAMDLSEDKEVLDVEANEIVPPFAGFHVCDKEGLESACSPHQQLAEERSDIPSIPMGPRPNVVAGVEHVVETSATIVLETPSLDVIADGYQAPTLRQPSHSRSPSPSGGQSEEPIRYSTPRRTDDATQYKRKTAATPVRRNKTPRKASPSPSSPTRRKRAHPEELTESLVDDAPLTAGVPAPRD